MGSVVSPASASDCSRTSTGLIPLTDSFFRSYQGVEGGLYPGGSNHRPASHEAAGLRLGAEVRPRGPSGAVDELNGKIVLLSIGMSNTTQEFSLFKNLADADPEKNPKLVVVDGAQGGWTADKIVLTGDQYWATVDTRLAAAGVTAAQVQAGWLKEALAQPAWLFPQDAQLLQSYLKPLVRILRSRFPNLRLLHLSSRIYAGYASSALNPEPYAYQSGFSVKWLIEEQMNGDPELSFDAGQAPWLSWGPYLWADGTREREDGLIWECRDLQPSDGTHPSDSGRQKVADMLLNFLKSDTTARPWFVRPTQPAPPQPSPAAVVNAADYSGRVAAGSIASIYGDELSTASASSPGLPLPPILGGTVVRIGGEPAPLYYVSPRQINFLIPASPAGEDIVVVREGAASTPVHLSASTPAPAIFTLDGRPDGPAAAIHADGRVVTAQTPAAPGEPITLLLTGLGRRNIAVLSMTVMPGVRVAERQAQVNTAGPVAGSPGLDRISFTVPPETIPGNAWLTVYMGPPVSNRVALAVGKTVQPMPAQ